MKKLLNVLYILSEDAYLALDGETVRVMYEDGSSKSIPLHLLEGIVSFSYKGASPSLMGKCVENGVRLSFYSPHGRYLASVENSTNGNVHLYRAQYRMADDDTLSLNVARNFICGKLYNAKFVLLRCARDHEMRVDTDRIRRAADNISAYLLDAQKCQSISSLRGVEGNSAEEYFSVFDEMILQNKDQFSFDGRSRRPPLDKTNALLSFAYSLLASECSAALYGVGLNPYVGFMHVDKSGRKSLALDMEEELRASFADRFVLTLINNRIVCSGDFNVLESGAVVLTDDGRRKFLDEWQKKKKTVITHPFLKEKIEWGLVPHIQALLLARYIRGDIEQYPPFFWK